MFEFEPTATNIALTSGMEIDRRSWQQDHDLLSFLALFLETYNCVSVDLTFATVLLDDLCYGMPNGTHRGGSFSITLAPARIVYARRSIRDGIPGSQVQPELVALKTPIIESIHSVDSPESRLLLNAIAAEVQVLRDSQLRSHRNIVTLLGICWQSFTADSSLILPVLILEAADCGDLNDFMRSGRGNELGVQLRLGIDVSSGVYALHAASLIHCDIKPENILVFTDHHLGKNGYIAKIADFGSSIFSSEVADEIELHMGTRIWQPPEYGQQIDRQNLPKIDIYSMGLVLFFVLAGSDAGNIATWLTQEPELQELKQDDTLMRTVYANLEHKATITYAEDEAAMKLFTNATLCVCMSLMCRPEHRVNDALFIAENFSNYLVSLNETGISASNDRADGEPQRTMRTQRNSISYANSEKVIQALLYQGTLAMLPDPLINQLRTQTKMVSRDSAQSANRRRQALFDCFVLDMRALRFPLVDTGQLTSCYRSLQEAADLGDELSRYLLGSQIFSLGNDPNVSSQCQGTPTPLASKISIDAAAILKYSTTNASIELETDHALVIACMEGNGEMVKSLLSRNNIESPHPWHDRYNGITPLHFLGMFPEAEVTTIGNLLLTQSINIEARWENVEGMWPAMELYCSYCQRGTPLLWAVAACNLSACKFLLEHGADPYDTAGLKLPTENRWGDNIRMSPIHLAALMHLPEILKLLITTGPSSSLDANLRTCWLPLAGTDTSVSPLYWAVDYIGEGPIRRLLLHGTGHTEACLLTIGVLLEHGANARQLTNGHRPMTALHLAIQGGHSFLVEFLLKWNNGLLRPHGAELRSIIYLIGLKSDDAMLRVLTENIVFTEEHLIDVLDVLPDLVEKTNSLAIVKPLVEAILAAPNVRQDLSEAFLQALIAGNLEIASYIFHRGLDFDCLRLRPTIMLSKSGDQSQWSILGRLLASAKTSRNLHSRLETLLSLLSEHDLLLGSEAALNSPDINLTPLQFAALELEYDSRHNDCGPIIEVLLDYFDTPAHLNAPTRIGGTNQAFVSTSGYTPLHWAVHAGNRIAVNKLLAEEDVDTEILSDRNCNAYDIALERFETDGLPHFSNWPRLRREERSLADRYAETTWFMIGEFNARNLIPHKYRLAVYRVDEQVIHVRGYAPDLPIFVLENCDLARIPDNCDRVMKRIKALEVGGLVPWATPVETVSMASQLLANAIRFGHGSCGFIASSSTEAQ